MNDIDGYTGLAGYINRGISLQPKIYSKDLSAYIFIKKIYQDPDKWVNSLNRLDWWLENGVHNFSLIPAMYGMIVIDIDMKAPYNGIAKFSSYFSSPEEGYKHIQNHPFRVHTPSGGCHLYYRYEGYDAFRADLGDGLEMKSGNMGITACGSRKGEDFYWVAGRSSLDNVPAIVNYPTLYWAFKKPRYKRQAVSRPQYKPDMDYMVDDLESSSHNNLLKFVGRCIRAGYSKSECEAYVNNNPHCFGSESAERSYQITDLYNRYS